MVYVCVGYSTTKSKNLSFSEQVSHIKISDVYSESSQTSKIKYFTKIVSDL